MAKRTPDTPNSRAPRLAIPDYDEVELRRVIGLIVKETRTSAKLSQKQLGALLGKSSNSNAAISQLEKGISGLKFVDFVKLAESVDRDPHELLAEYLKRRKKA